MLIAVLGGVGLGLVWGWLMGGVVAKVRLSPLTTLALSVATLLLAIEVLLLAGWLVLALLLIMAALSIGLHFAWRHELRNRFESPI